MSLCCMKSSTKFQDFFMFCLKPICKWQFPTQHTWQQGFLSFMQSSENHNRFFRKSQKTWHLSVPNLPAWLWTIIHFPLFSVVLSLCLTPSNPYKLRQNVHFVQFLSLPFFSRFINMLNRRPIDRETEAHRSDQILADKDIFSEQPETQPWFVCSKKIICFRQEDSDGQTNCLFPFCPGMLYQVMWCNS